MKKLLMATMLLAFGATAHAQWTQTSGPVGGAIYSIATDGTTLIAAAVAPGLWLHTGSGWRAIDSIHPNIVFAAGNVLFASTLEGYLYRSEDGGAGWSRVGPNLMVRNLTGSGNDLFIAGGQWVYHSTDQGKTWTESGTIDNGYIDQIIATDSGLVVRIYDESSEQRFALSADNGATWREAGEGMPKNAYMHSWTASGSRVYASFAGFGVYTSSDGGINWEEANRGLPAGAEGYYSFGDIHMGAGNTWLGTSRGIYLLESAGWRKLTAEPANAVMTYTGASGSQLFFSSNAGISKAQLPGLNLISLTDDTRMQRVDGLARSAGSILAATPGGIYRSTDQGNTWLRAHPYQTRAIAMSGTRGVAAIGQQEGGLYRTVDDGRTWTEATGDGLTEPLLNLGALASAGLDIYAGFTDTYSVGGSEDWVTGGVFRSTDGGAHWTAASSGLPTRTGKHAPVLKLAAWGSDVVAVTVAGVYHSPDKGGSWEKADVELTGHQWNNHVVSSLDTFYLASGHRLYRSAGDTGWTPESLVLSEDDSILELAMVNGIPIVVVSHPSSGTMEIQYHIYVRGRDGWKRLENLPEGVRFYRFIGVGEYVYGGTFEHSIWRAPLSAIGGGRSGVEQSQAPARILSSSPNPFGDETVIRFSTASAAHTRLSVVDPFGRQVAGLFDGHLPAGEHQFRLDGRDLAPGAYFYRIESNGTVSAGKLVKGE